MEKKKDGMSMAERRAKGLLWVDTGENMEQQVYARGLCQDFNRTRPTDTEKERKFCRSCSLPVGSMSGLSLRLRLPWETPFPSERARIINSNLTLVDDYEINIGEDVLIAPNVTISTTNHPLHYMARPHGEMYCKKVTIESNVWIGSNVVICAGVTVGKGAVIGAGSVVTRDVPPMCFAAGVPCKVIREITDEDLKEFEPIPE